MARAGQASRFAIAEGDREAVTGTSDLIEADDASERGEHTVALRLLAAGLAPDLPSSDWVEDLRAVDDRRGTEVAIRVMAADADRRAQRPRVNYSSPQSHGTRSFSMR